MGFSRQEYWHGLPFPSLGYLPDPGIKPRSLAVQVDSLLSELYESPSHIHKWVLFSLWLHLFIFFGVISLFFSSSILGTYWPGEFIFQCCYLFFFFSYCHVVLKARILKWFPFSSGPHLSELSTMTHPSCVAPHSMAHSFLELDKAVIQAINLVSFLWLWFSSCLPSDG